MRKTIYGIISFLLMFFLTNPLALTYAQQAEQAAPSRASSSQIIESLEFREVDIKDVLRHLAKQYNLNIIFSEQVKGLVTVQLNNVTIDEALDSIITVNGFAYTRKENVIKVTTPEEAMREGKETRVIRLNNADATSLKTELVKVLSESGSIEADTRSNSLIVTDNPMVIEKIEKKIIPSLDGITPQVLIEAKIIETSLSRSEKLGIDWSTTIKAIGSKRPTTFPFSSWGANQRMYPSPQQTTDTEGEWVENPSIWVANPNEDPATPGDEFVHPYYWQETIDIESDFPYNVSESRFGSFPMASADEFTFGTLDFTSLQAVFDFLKTRSDTKLVANPRIVTLNNKTATINVGQVLSIPKYTLNEETGNKEITDWEPKDVGVTLQVTPQVSPDGLIKLKLKPEVSSLVGYAGTREGVKEGPITSTRTAETEVQIRDGQTVVIAGLIKNKTYNMTSKIPILGDIPGLNLLFTRKEKSLEADPDEKTDLLIFVTARIIKDTDKPLLAWEHNVMTAPPRPLKLNMKTDMLDPRFKVGN